MKNIVVFNFKRHGDIFSSNNVLEGIKGKHPHCFITYVCFKEFESSASCLSSIDKIITLDRKKYESVRKNKLFCNSLAVNTFSKEIQPIINERWDFAVNLSNDGIALYLSSYLRTKKIPVYGISYSQDKEVIASNDYANYLNDIISEFHYTPINLINTQKGILEINKDGLRSELRENKEFEQTVVENFDTLRRKTNNSKLIGIQLFSSCASKTLVKEELCELIKEIQTHKNIIPVLLIAPTDEERDFANSINEEIQQKNIIIESGFEAAVSVIKHLDYIITPDTSIKHLADQTNTPVVEISLGASPLFKQGTINPNSIIVTPLVSRRLFNSACTARLNHKDVLGALFYLLGDINEIQASQYTNASFYRYQSNKYRLVNSISDPEAEILLAFAENFVAFKFEQTMPCYTFSGRQNVRFLQSILAENKNHLLACSKTLLSCIRKLAHFKNNSSSITQLVDCLESLYLYDKNNQLTCLPLKYFQRKIENINEKNQDKKIEVIEQALFALKKDLKVASTIIDSINMTLSRTTQTHI